MIPDGEYQAAPTWTLAGDAEEMTCVLGIRPTPGNTFSSVSYMCELVNQALLAAQVCTAATMATGWTYLGVTGYQRVGTDIIAGAFPQAIAGTGAWGTPPNNCTVLWKKLSSDPGRSGRGRMYLPPFGVDETTVSASGVLGTTFLSGQVTKANAVLTEFASRELLMTIQHADGSPSTPVLQLAPQSQMATQRRRMRR